MNKMFIAILLVLSLVGCGKVDPKQEYLPLMEYGGVKYYVASPSGIVYYQATDSEIKVWHDSKGNVKNIYEVQNGKD